MDFDINVIYLWYMDADCGMIDSMYDFVFIRITGCIVYRQVVEKL